MKETFSDRVIEAAQSIPPGKVTTYGDLAKAAGGGGQAARSVTSILGRAHASGVKGIPFHRIVFAGGKIWIHSDYYQKRVELFKQEGVEITEKGIVKNFNDVRYQF